MDHCGVSPPDGQESACWRCVWASARCLDDQADAVAAWVEGRLDATPGHTGPPSPETVVIREPLLRICAAGVVTTGSQLGSVTPTGRQRAYLNGYGPGPLVAHLGAVVAERGFVVDTWPSSPRVKSRGHGTVVTECDRAPTRTSGRFGLEEAFPHLGRTVPLTPQARAAMEASVSFVFVDRMWGRAQLLFTALADVADTWRDRQKT